MIGSFDGWFVYVGILLAASLEGEVAYVAASALVAQDILNPAGVIVAGAAGAALGDQCYFYLLRGRLTRVIDRFPRVARRVAPLIGVVRRHDTAMVLLIRFAPGLRIAIAAACAHAGVPPLKFSLLNGASALVWAVTLTGLIDWLGPTCLSGIGLSGWKGAVAMGLLVIAAFRLLARVGRRTLPHTT